VTSRKGWNYVANRSKFETRRPDNMSLRRPSGPCQTKFSMRHRGDEAQLTSSPMCTTSETPQRLAERPVPQPSPNPISKMRTPVPHPSSRFPHHDDRVRVRHPPQRAMSLRPRSRLRNNASALPRLLSYGSCLPLAMELRLLSTWH
jgi:hypothetical protein